MKTVILSLALLAAVGCGGAAAGGAASEAPSHTAALVPPPAPNTHDYPAELNPLFDHFDRKDYAGGAAFLAEHSGPCLASRDCAHMAEVLFYNWSIGYENEGDWTAARKVLQDCVAAIHDAVCSARLADLESQHRF